MTHVRRFRMTAVALCSLAAPHFPAWGLAPVGPEFPILEGGVPYLAADGRGGMVVVWSNTEVFAQRLDPQGTALGPAFQVNLFTAREQFDARVAADAAGNFVIVWTSMRQDGHDLGVFAQRFDAAGNRLGDEFNVSTWTTGAQFEPAMAMDADGDFTVAWTDDGRDGSYDGVYAQRFGAAGERLDAEFRVAGETRFEQTTPAVAMNAGGALVVAWQAYEFDTGRAAIWARRYDTDGQAIGEELELAPSPSIHSPTPMLAMDGQGDFLVAWQHENLRGKLVTAGVAGDELGFDSLRLGEAALAMDGSGNFLLAGVQRVAANRLEIVAYRFNDQGQQLGSSFQVNTTTTHHQRAPSVAMGADGDFAVVWNTGTFAPGSMGQRFCVGAPYEINLVAAPPSLREGRSVNLEIELSEASTTTVRVPFVIEHERGHVSDFVASPGPAVIRAGETRVRLTRLTAVDDAQPEESERLLVRLLEPSGCRASIGASSQARIRILDND